MYLVPSVSCWLLVWLSFTTNLPDHLTGDGIKIMALKDIWQQQRQQRREELQQRKTEVDTMLVEMRDRRQQQSEQLAIDLDLYVQQVRTDTQNYLSQVTRDRLTMATELQQSLQQFRQNLHTSSQALRQELQTDLQLMRIEVQTMLDQNRQARAHMSAQQQVELAEFCDRLQADVIALLTDCAIQREERAIAVADMLVESRTQRQVAVADLFEQFAQFRQELTAFHRELKQSVWGDSVGHDSLNGLTIATEETVEAVLAMPEIKNAPQSKSAKSGASAATAKAEPVLEEPIAPASVETESIAPVLAADLTVSISDQIIALLADRQKSRLSDLAASLRLSQTDTAQALRKLIQEGRIIQRDRYYLLQA